MDDYKIFLINFGCKRDKFMLDYLCSEYEFKPSAFAFSPSNNYNIISFVFMETNCSLKGDDPDIKNKLLVIYENN